MRDFQDRRRLRKMVYSKLTIILLLLLFLLMSRALWRVYTKNALALNQNEKTNSRLEELESQKAELAEKVKWLSTKRGQEEAVRQNFSVVKEGEKVMLVVDDKDASTTTVDDKNKSGWLEVIKHLFSGWW